MKKLIFHEALTIYIYRKTLFTTQSDQSVENAGVAFLKGAN